MASFPDYPTPKLSLTLKPGSIHPTHIPNPKSLQVSNLESAPPL